MLGAALATVNARVGRRFLVWAAAAAALALALDFVPLFDLLGYDFSFALGLLAAAASVDIGCGVARAARRRRGAGDDGASDGGGTIGASDVLGRAGEAIGFSLAILALPLLLSLGNAARVRNCNVAGGLAFFVLLPVATAVYGAAAGLLAGLGCRRRARLVAFLLPLASIAWTLERLYVDPPVFAFDPFGGFFPGPIYDEALRAPPALIAYRAVNLVWIAAALAVARAASSRRADRPGGAPWDVRRWRRAPTAVATALVIAGAVLFARRGELGFAVRKPDLLAALDGERHSNRIVLRYATAGAPAATELGLTMEDLEFRYDQLRETLGVEPDGPITVYQFPSAEMKKAMVGAGATLYAKPWTREIFVQAGVFPSGRLRHEMAHVFAGAFGDRFFGVALAIKWHGPLPVPTLASGLIEGVAEAADFTDPDGGATTHQEAEAIVVDGRAPPLSAVVGAGFSTLSGARAYTLAGSFCRWLLDTRGAARLRDVYRSAGDFQGVYGASLPSLETEWRKFLARQTLSAAQRARAREQFRRPAIFKKVCAREQAARIVEARSLVPTAPVRAAHLLEQACDDDPGEPTIQIELAQAWAAAGDQTRALERLAAVARNGDATAPVRARAATAAATIHFHAGDFDNTRAALRAVLDDATDEGERRTATAKLRALDDEAARRTLGRALFGESEPGHDDPVLAFFLLSDFARLHPEDPLGPYLIGRQLATRDPRLALPYLRDACEPTGAAHAFPTPLSADFRRECARMTMLAAFRAGDLLRSHAAAAQLYTEAGATGDEAERLRAGDFLARIAWKQSKQ